MLERVARPPDGQYIMKARSLLRVLMQKVKTALGPSVKLNVREAKCQMPMLAKIFGVKTRPRLLSPEPANVQAVGNVFLSTEANTAGYGLSISSDSDMAVPDSGMTLSFFGMALTGIAFLRRRIG
jgi:hypothetical protein